MSRRPIECATGVDLDRAVADGRVSVADADQVRAFAQFLQAAPPPPKPDRGYTREQLVQLRAAYVDLGDHEDVIEKIDQVLA
jgi:hypothetical protein